MYKASKSALTEWPSVGSFIMPAYTPERHEQITEVDKNLLGWWRGVKKRNKLIKPDKALFLLHSGDLQSWQEPKRKKKFQKAESFTEGCTTAKQILSQKQLHLD